MLQNDSGSSSSGQYSTKVTATANIKVEVVAPMYRERGRPREERVSCHRVVCSDGREKRKTKCKNERPNVRPCNSKRDSTCRNSRRCERRDICQVHRDSCRHSCWEEEDRDRRYCDNERRRSRHRRDSDTSDSDDDNKSDKCWTQNEKTNKTEENNSSPPNELCTNNSQ